MPMVSNKNKKRKCQGLTQDWTIMSKVALVYEWLNKNNGFKFEIVNEGEHNLEEKTEQNR